MTTKTAPAPAPLPELLTVEDLAALCKVETQTVHTWRKFGTAPKAFFLGRSLRFTRDDVHTWLAAHQADAR